MLSGDYAEALVFEFWSLQVRCEYGPLGFLILEEERISVVFASHETHPATCPNAAYTDYFSGHVHYVIARDELSSVLGQGREILFQEYSQSLLDGHAVLCLCLAYDERSVFDDSLLVVDEVGHL